MTTLNKIAYDIAHTQGREDDFPYIERLKFRIHQLRATIIRRDLDRNRFTPHQFLQNIGCVDMEFVDASSCCGVTVGCKVFRSKLRLPSPVRFKDKTLFYFVGTIDSKKGYSPISTAELNYFEHSKYNSNVPRYYFEDNYLYLIGDSPRTVQVKGVFEYPHELAAHNNCDGSPCYSDDSAYPITIDLVRNITEAILNFDITRENPNAEDNEITIDG